MIVTELSGGLGNQMFQYALGRVLSLKHDAELLFDITPFDYQPHTNTKRTFELDVYNVPGTIAPKSIVERWGRPNRYKIILNHYLNLGLNPYPKNYIKEDGHVFHPEILTTPDNIYLSGYWQSEKYIVSERSTLISDFTARSTQISPTNKKLSAAIASSESVSLHVRRTDYVTNPSSNAFHGVCDLNYYHQAMSRMERKVKKPTYFVFSDDPVWARGNIKSRHKLVFVTHNQGRDAHEDLRHMANCKHNITANSSFSWWGAWLNTHTDRLVISPKRWFNTNQVNTKDLIPTQWVKI